MLKEENPNDSRMVINNKGKSVIADEMILNIDDSSLGIQVLDALDSYPLSVYPNPANRLLNVAFGQAASPKVQIKLYNLLGQAIFLEEFQTNLDGTNLIPLNIEELDPGYYLLTVIDGKKKQSISFIKSE